MLAKLQALAPFDAAIDTVFLPYDIYVLKCKEDK